MDDLGKMVIIIIIIIIRLLLLLFYLDVFYRIYAWYNSISDLT